MKLPKLSIRPSTGYFGILTFYKVREVVVKSYVSKKELYQNCAYIENRNGKFYIIHFDEDTLLGEIIDNDDYIDILHSDRIEHIYTRKVKKYKSNFKKDDYNDLFILTSYLTTDIIIIPPWR